MRAAYQSMREVWWQHDGVQDLRTAGFIVSIGRVAEAYQAKGI